MRFLQYFIPRHGTRTSLARQNPVRYLDASKKSVFAPNNTPSKILDDIKKANKVVLPIHGYQPQAWLWAEPFEEGQLPPYGNYGGQAYCDAIRGALERANGGTLDDDVFVLYPIWASNELWYTSTVRENAEWAGERLGQDLATFQEHFPKKELEFIAHSAGGLVATKALVTLSKASSGRLDKIRQTLLNPDVPSESFERGETAEAIRQLHSTLLVHDPSDRALLGAQIADKHHPLDKHIQSGESGLPDVVREDLERERSSQRTAGREGLSSNVPGNVDTMQISLSDALRHTGHANVDELESAWKSILEPHTKLD